MSRYWLAGADVPCAICGQPIGHVVRLAKFWMVAVCRGPDCRRANAAAAAEHAAQVRRIVTGPAEVAP